MNNNSVIEEIKSRAPRKYGTREGYQNLPLLECNQAELIRIIAAERNGRAKETDTYETKIAELEAENKKLRHELKHQKETLDRLSERMGLILNTLTQADVLRLLASPPTDENAKLGFNIQVKIYDELRSRIKIPTQYSPAR
jgi:chromosome segregation ATPase